MTESLTSEKSRATAFHQLAVARVSSVSVKFKASKTLAGSGFTFINRPTLHTITTTMDNQLIFQASQELEALRKQPSQEVHFPPACMKLMLSLRGNSHCVDCGCVNPEWASVSYGTLICMQCSGKHRSFGVQTSFVRSVRMDTWKHGQILSMLEGGNAQLTGFLERHDLGTSSELYSKRYHTKAAKFYRTQLAKHVEHVSGRGEYQGRDASRGKQSTSSCAKSHTTAERLSQRSLSVSAQ